MGLVLILATLLAVRATCDKLSVANEFGSAWPGEKCCHHQEDGGAHVDDCTARSARSNGGSVGSGDGLAQDSDLSKIDADEFYVQLRKLVELQAQNSGAKNPVDESRREAIRARIQKATDNVWTNIGTTKNVNIPNYITREKNIGEGSSDLGYGHGILGYVPNHLAPSKEATPMVILLSDKYHRHHGNGVRSVVDDPEPTVADESQPSMDFSITDSQEHMLHFEDEAAITSERTMAQQVNPELLRPKFYIHHPSNNAQSYLNFLNMVNAARETKGSCSCRNDKFGASYDRPRTVVVVPQKAPVPRCFNCQVINEIKSMRKRRLREKPLITRNDSDDEDEAEELEPEYRIIFKPKKKAENAKTPSKSDEESEKKELQTTNNLTDSRNSAPPHVAQDCVKEINNGQNQALFQQAGFPYTGFAQQAMTSPTFVPASNPIPGAVMMPAQHQGPAPNTYTPQMFSMPNNMAANPNAVNPIGQMNTMEYANLANNGFNNFPVNPNIQQTHFATPIDNTTNFQNPNPYPGQVNPTNAAPEQTNFNENPQNRPADSANVYSQTNLLGRNGQRQIMMTGQNFDNSNGANGKKSDNSANTKSPNDHIINLSDVPVAQKHIIQLIVSPEKPTRNLKLSDKIKYGTDEITRQTVMNQSEMHTRMSVDDAVSEMPDQPKPPRRKRPTKQTRDREPRANKTPVDGPAARPGRRGPVTRNPLESVQTSVP